MENLRACETMNSLLRCVSDTKLAASDHYAMEWLLCRLAVCECYVPVYMPRVYNKYLAPIKSI